MSDSPQEPGSFARSDVLTIVAVGIVAYALANVLHEGMGHGGACVVLGGRPETLSSTFFSCDNRALSWWSGRLIAAAGPLMNLLAGLAFLGLLRTFRAASPVWRYFLWLSMTVNLLQAGGYTMVSPFAGFGDWTGFLGGLEPRLLWQIVLTVCGVAVSVLGLGLGLVGLRPFLGEGELSGRVRKAWTLTLLPYLTGGLLACVAGALNPAGMHVVVLSAAASTLAGTCWLIWLPFWVRHLPAAHGEALVLRRNVGWLIAGAIAALVFIAVLGPSVHFQPAGP